MEALEKGSAHVIANFNKTIVEITDADGKVISKTDTMVLGFKRSSKKFLFASEQVAEIVAKDAMQQGIKYIDVYCRGSGTAHEAAIRILKTVGLQITLIKNLTPIPHNGCRPHKRRRI